MAHAVRSLDALRALAPSIAARVGDVSAVMGEYPMAIPPYYLSLANADDPNDPIVAMALPRDEELARVPWLKADVFDEDEQMPVPGLVRRYRDRALLLVTSTCAMYCRHCFRKRIVGKGGVTVGRAALDAMVAWLAANPEVKDVILSGGDPLAVPDKSIERILEAVRAVPSVEIIRVHTRMPVVLPQRVTEELCAMLSRHHPIYVNVHFNHPRELTAEAAVAVDRLTRAGIAVGNQAVLLRGVNDDADTLEALFRGLLKMRVKPYYLFQSDLAEGVEHLRTPVAKGIELMGALRRRMGGMGLPKFTLDMPGGGKIPLEPSYIVGVEAGRVVLKNPEGVTLSYPDAVP